MARKAGKAVKMNTQSPNSPAYLTMSEYSIKAGISLSQVKRLKLANRLPFIQEGKLVRIPAQALDYNWFTNWRTNRGLNQKHDTPINR